MTIYYWNNESQNEFSIEKIREKHPNVSIPDGADLSFIGYLKIKEVQSPEYDDQTSMLLKGIEYIDGVLTRKWIVASLPEEEIEIKKKEKQDFIKSYFIQQAQFRLDKFAKTGGYDNILSACTYATDSNLKFRSEGQRCVDLRSATWSKSYEILQEVLDGIRPVPTSFDQIESELPALTWN